MRHLLLVALCVVLGLVVPPDASSQSFNRLHDASDLEGPLYPSGTRALLISVSQYADPAWPELHSDRDVDRIRDVLVAHGLREKDDITIVKLKPSGRLPGTADPIRTAVLSTFAKTLPPLPARRNLRIIVYYAGHGFSRDGHGYLVPPNAPNPRAAESDFLQAALAQEQFLDDVEGLHAGATLVVLDACFSGLAMKPGSGERAARAPLNPDEWPRVFQIITAGNAAETVPDDNLFSQLLAAGLNGAADLNFDGWITGNELGEYLRVRMTEESIAARRTRQTPQFGIDPGRSLGDMREGGVRFASPQQLPIEGLAAAAGTTSPTALRAFRDCPDCPSLRIVPRPAGSASPAAGYLALGVTDVTVTEYEACFRAHGCNEWPRIAADPGSHQPVTGVSWDDALAYTRWLTCITGRAYRLPTEAEWQLVAAQESHRVAPRAGDGRAAAANCRGCGSPWDGREPAPVASFASGDYGLYDLLGNVWQWTGDCVHGGQGRCAQASVRGGAFTTRASALPSLPRGTLRTTVRDLNIGFRVARDQGAVVLGSDECTDIITEN